LHTLPFLCTCQHIPQFHSHPTVLIIGAGPVGLLTALRLGRAQIPTLVLERHTNLLPTTRAVVYQPVVLPALRSLGILSHIESQAFLNHDGIVWRDISGAQLANMPISGVKGEGEEKAPFDGVLLIGQARMNDLILEELRKCPSVEVRFGHQLVGLEQHPERGSVTAMVHKTNPPHDDEVFIEAEYVVGTDGANSTVRRLSCIPFEGFTWNEFRMIGADVYYDFAKENGYTPLNFIVHPQEWAVIVYTGQDRHGDPYGKETPLWRVAYGESREMSEKPEEIMERAKARLQRYAKGSTDIEIKRAEPYNLHQRCAKQARKGRVLLAGDALHVSSPDELSVADCE